MSSLIGLGVLGTFGQPFGFQQAFYLGAELTESLDLDEDIIEVYPGNELFAVKREMVDGVVSTCFCIYSYIKELYSDRISTFMGTCVVLQDGYVDADYIYKLLREFNTNVKENPDNISDNTMKVQQAQNLVVREPESFTAVKANVIPINKTPFYSTGIEAGKRLLVHPEAGDSRSLDEQVIAFFDDAVKFYTDTDVIYLTLDEDVVRYTSSKRPIKTMGWNEFVAPKNKAQQQGVVRTKKGIRQPMAEDTATTATEPAEEPAPYVYTPPEPVYSSADAYTSNADEDEPEADRPFDEWEEPYSDWSREEARQKVKEYNRLFKYTNTLQARINEPEQKKGRKKDRKNKERATEVSAAFDDTQAEDRVVNTSLRHRLTGTKKKRGILLLVVLGILVAGGVVFNMFFDQGTQAPGPTIVGNSADAQPEAVKNVAMNPTDTMTETKTTSAGADTAVLTSSGTPEPQPSAPPVSKTVHTATPVSSAPVSMPSLAQMKKESVSKIMADKPPKIAQEQVMPEQKDAASNNITTTNLRPAPNFEISQKDVISWKADIKDKTPLQITNIIFQIVPSNIGNIYKGQEQEYANYFLNVNKHAFRLVEGEYICLANEVVLYIPAYKAPRK